MTLLMLIVTVLRGSPTSAWMTEATSTAPLSCIMTLGCTVARFGLLLRESGGKAPQTTSPWLSTGFGVTLALGGAALMIRATLRYSTTIDASDRTLYRPSPGLSCFSPAVPFLWLHV